MKTISIEKRSTYLASGTLGLIVSAVYIALTSKLPFGTMDRPGAAVFPFFVSIAMIFGSLATLWEGFRMDRLQKIELPFAEDLYRVLALVALLAGYAAVLQWLGQLLAGFVFSAVLMRVLSRTAWWRIVIYSFVLSAVIDLLFVRFLSVPLPKGMIGW